MKPTKHLPLLLNTLPHSLLLRAEIAHKRTHGGDVTWLYCEAPKSLSFQMTQIPEAFHFVSSIIINLSFLFYFFPGLTLLQANSLAKRLGHPPASTLSFVKTCTHVLPLISWVVPTPGVIRVQKSQARKLSSSQLLAGSFRYWRMNVLCTSPSTGEDQALLRNAGDPRQGNKERERSPTDPLDKKPDNL